MPRYQGWYFMQVKKIVMKHQGEKIDGVFIDVQTAHVIMQAYMRNSRDNQVNMMQHPIGYIASKIWNLVR